MYSPQEIQAALEALVAVGPSAAKKVIGASWLGPRSLKQSWGDHMLASIVGWHQTLPERKVGEQSEWQGERTETLTEKDVDL